MEIVFRPIEEKDNPAMAALIRGILEEFGLARPGTVYTDPTTDALYQLFQAEGSAYLVAESGGVLVGGCGIYPTPGLPDGCGELVKFYVASACRGQGIGRDLLQANLAVARALGYQQLYLESFPELSKAVSMYEKAGFRELPHALGQSGHTACTLWMLKDLQEQEEGSAMERPVQAHLLT